MISLKSSILFSFLLVVPVFCAEAERVFHVAPSGNDAHEGSAAQPFATLDRARQAVREHLATRDQRGDLVVEFAAGTYELKAPVRFSPEDSGQNGFAVVYRAAPGANVVLSGGRPITGWERSTGGVYRAPVGAGVDFRQLWIGDRRATRARTPNEGEMLTMNSEKHADGFDLPTSLFSGVTLRPNEVEVSVLIAWMHKRLRIARLAVTEAAGTTRAVIAEPEWDGVTKQPQGDRVYLNRHYWLENAPEFLDAPGEFYLDHAAGEVRYQPRANETPTESRLIRPELENLIVLEGRLDAPVHDLRFENFGFSHTGWTRPNRFGFVDVQANSLVPIDVTTKDPQYRHDQKKDRIPAAFQAYTADRITLRGCRFTQLGGTAVMFTHGGNDNIVEGNTFHDIAAGGIEFGEDAARPENPRLFPQRNRIAHNFLSHVGQDYFGSVAILGYYTEASEIAHNEIANIPYTAISQGWGWGNPPAPAQSRDNRITHNLVTNYMRRLDDGGGIYTTDRLLGSEIAHNVVSRMLPPDAETKAGGALYLDQFTEGTRVYDNLVTEAIRWLFIWNPNIQRNHVAANFSDTAALRNEGTENHVEPAKLLGAEEAVADAARRLRAEAGLGAAFVNARAYTTTQRLVLDTTGPDFHAPTQEWTPAPATSGLAANARQSTVADTSARWFPLLPQSGRHEIRLWQPAAGPALNVVVQTATAQSAHVLVSQPKAGWQTVGTFDLPAGAGTTVVVTRRERSEQPLVLEALELTRAAR